MNEFELARTSEINESVLVHTSGYVAVYRLEVWDDVEFLVVRSFGRNGSDGIRLVHRGTSLSQAAASFEEHTAAARIFAEETGFYMTPNGS